ncbi:hypothetical protein H0H93_000951 [Arthromyces matolae]|nr:hypothetical protein H0H93_000951 [Arthromyces matolae]
MDAAAAAIAEAVLRAETLPRTLNLVNPRSTDINIVIAYLLAAMVKLLGKHLNIVPMKEWLAKLEECAVNATTDTLKEIPAIIIIPYFRDIYRASEDVLATGVMSQSQFPFYASEKMCEVSPRTYDEGTSTDADRGCRNVDQVLERCGLPSGILG